MRGVPAAVAGPLLEWDAGERKLDEPGPTREARLRIAAEFTPADIAALRELLDIGLLELDGLISHACPAAAAETAYPQAFTDPACLKMVLDWRQL